MIDPRERLRRQGGFREEGMPLKAEEHEIHRPLIERAEELGYMPIRAEVPSAGRVKGEFRCWKDAIRAAGLPSEEEQAEKRMAAGKNTN